MDTQAATCVCDLAALPAGLGSGILDETVLWHAVAGLNLLSPEAAEGLSNAGGGGGDADAGAGGDGDEGGVVYCSNHEDGHTLAQFECKQCPPLPSGRPTALCAACDQVRLRKKRLRERNVCVKETFA